MGSRAIMVVCKDLKAAQKHFKESGDKIGVCYTRTGRPFFNDPSLEGNIIGRMRQNLEKADIWNILKTDWLCLDCEIMPWSAKARSLLQEQYAPVGASSQYALRSVIQALEKAKLDELAEKYRLRESAATAYIDAYSRYCWPVYTIDDYKIAPFHLLASEGMTYFSKDHQWHMDMIHKICNVDPHWLNMTSYKIVDVNNPQEYAQGCDWWTGITGNGGEGMVVKPLDFTVTKGNNDLLQPGIKIRGKEYLRIIYGPEYALQENLSKLKERNLGKKRSLALREYALGMEALERFVEKEPLYRVHECVFAILALECEPVDPRL